MKKLINVFVLIMLNVFLLAGSVNANIKAFVSNENGAAVYGGGDILEKNYVLEKGTEVNIASHYDSKKDYYYIYGNKSGDSWYYGYGWIKKEDVKLASGDVVSGEAFSKNEDIRKVYVLQDDCYLYKGPSAHVYGKVTENKIPKGTILEYQYTEIEGDHWGEYGYIYTTYEGRKGWVLFDKLAKVIPSKIMIATDNAKLLKDFSGDSIEDLGVTIPKYTELDIEYIIDIYGLGYDLKGEKKQYYEVNGYDSEYAHVTYNGVSGWINGIDYATPNDNSEKFIVIDENTTMQTESGENKKISFFDEIEYKYCYSRYTNNKNYDYYYIEDNEIFGWIKDENLAFPSTIESILIQNRDGAKAINQKGKTSIIPYHTEIDEILYSGSGYIVVLYNDEKVLLNKNDCMTYYGEYDIYFTISEITMYKDMDVNSEVICKIPKYSMIAEKYCDYSEGKAFHYIEYEDYKGWIYVSSDYYTAISWDNFYMDSYNNIDMICWYPLFNEDIKEEFEIYLTLKDIQIESYDPPYEIIKTIPKNSKIVNVFTAAVGIDEIVEVFLYENKLYAIYSIKEDEMQLIDTLDNKGLQEFLASEYGEEEQVENIVSGDEELNVSGDNEDINVQKDISKQVIIVVIATGILVIIAVIILKSLNKRKNKN